MAIEFRHWLEGIFEDDPLPDEIKILLFNVCVNNVYRYVEVMGFEKEINFNSIVYYPLEAQFFWNHRLAKYNKEKFYFEIKYMIEEAFVSQNLKKELLNRKIYLKNYTEIEFLFKV